MGDIPARYKEVTGFLNKREEYKHRRTGRNQLGSKTAPPKVYLILEARGKGFVPLP